jgi:arsenate reductase
MFTVYIHPKCSTCRQALDWLCRHEIPHRTQSIRECPPTVGELTEALRLMNGKLTKLFNTSGMDYRAMGIKERLPTMEVNEALCLLAGNGMLVKRPLLIGKGVALAGFKADAWKAALIGE